MPGLINAATALLSAATVVSASPAARLQQKRDIIDALPASASDLENKFQPILDFDTDGCYNTAAIDPSGYTNPGKDATGTPEGDCRDPHQLENSNVYSRSRCNNGVCAVMYEYYFEKDQANPHSFLSGHKHDWENVVVFSREGTDEVIWVAPSCHKGFNSGDGVLFDGTSPLIVYHKDGTFTHCFRVANGDDQAGVENHFGEFYKSPLVGWDNWPDVGLRDSMLAAWPDGVGPKLDTEFSQKLSDAAGDNVPDFDPFLE